MRAIGPTAPAHAPADAAGGGPADPPARRYIIGPHAFPVRAAEAGLYVVSTPIGNLADITLRALETLAGCDLVACEDTRVTRVLMERYGLPAPLVAYHEHNAARVRPRLLAALADGKAVAIVSDAGTPLVSDPGYRLVGAVVEAGHRVVPIPGASAPLSALVGAGLPSDTVIFAGFLPPKKGARMARLAELKRLPATAIVFESPRRLAATLAEMIETHGGDHPACVARELTKRFETFERGALRELAERFAGTPPKGEIVIVLGPARAAEASEADVADMLREAIADMPVSAAAAQVARQTGRDRKSLYRLALDLQQGDREGSDG